MPTRAARSLARRTAGPSSEQPTGQPTGQPTEQPTEQLASRPTEGAALRTLDERAAGEHLRATVTESAVAAAVADAAPEAAADEGSALVDAAAVLDVVLNAPREHRRVHREPLFARLPVVDLDRLERVTRQYGITRQDIVTVLVREFVAQVQLDDEGAGE